MAEDQKKLSAIEKEEAPDPPKADTEKSKEEPEAKPKKKLPIPKIGIKLPNFKRGKKEESAADSKDEAKSETVEEVTPLTPEQVVNDLDIDLNILDETIDEKYNQALERHIEKNDKQNITLTVSKKQFLFSFGFIVLISWAIPISQLAYVYLQSVNWKEVTRPRRVAANEATPSALVVLESTESGRAIRIKSPNVDEQAVAELIDIITTADVYQTVDAVSHEVTESKITVITKSSTTDEMASLSAILNDTETQLSTSSAILTEESTFDVLLLVPRTE